MRRRRHDPRQLTKDQRYELTAFQRPETSAFRTERHLRAAWDEHREGLIAETCEGRPGFRPWPFWEFEAERSQHLAPYPLDRSESIAERREVLDAYKLEPVVYVASRGELTEKEIQTIAAAAFRAQTRIGTDAERQGSGGIDWPDQRAATLWETVQTVMGVPRLPPQGDVPQKPARLRCRGRGCVAPTR